MKAERVRRVVVAAVAVLALAGCASKPRPLYHWGDYQSQVYAHFKGDGEGPEAQQGRLEVTAQNAQARNEALPPGFNAHLGLLYLKAGQADKARTAFRTEQAQFPESSAYMDFLLKKLDPSQEAAAP